MEWRMWLQKIKDWVDGYTVMIDADMYIANRKRREKWDWRSIIDFIYEKDLHKLHNTLCVMCCVAFIGVMLLVVNDLPQYGNVNNPANNEVSVRYVEEGLEETGAVNLVTGMILDYRAFDTFAEANVLFLSVMGVLFLLKTDKKNDDKQQQMVRKKDAEMEAIEQKPIRQIGAKYLTPFILLYGIYIVINGHISPGGGFAGGVIMGGGMIFYATAFGKEKMEQIFTFRSFANISVGSLLTYFVCKSYSFFTGANHVGWEVPKGVAGNILSAGLILPLNICVGLVVACTMYGFYALYTKGDI
ncbi:hydrogen gas-evolving membrane-bound hydrogenase subunit E [Chakrabartyella piscis]|uniref:hydrogen gas-evolving membrane-bound hydrogenase subunit E n=1 Tax=Chakrabartyella piscis TaxID=2918914 RepID=UPI002958D9E9|nr:hydrogen gas-evolving membrane-bound hydrogenase subunit E [Chakrabartyella piscis]